MHMTEGDIIQPPLSTSGS